MRSSTRRRTAVLSATAAGLALAACVAASCRGTGASGDPLPDIAEAAAAGEQWRDLDVERRAVHMKRFVLPILRAQFQSFDAERFAEFSCATCHGDGARDETFEMPNPKLPRLPGARDGFERLLAEKPDATKFMANVVVPTMAPLIGERPYGSEARDGFGCFRCHTTD